MKFIAKILFKLIHLKLLNNAKNFQKKRKKEDGSQNEENKLCSTCNMPMAKRRYFFLNIFYIKRCNIFIIKDFGVGHPRVLFSLTSSVLAWSEFYNLILNVIFFLIQRKKIDVIFNLLLKNIFDYKNLILMINLSKNLMPNSDLFDVENIYSVNNLLKIRVLCGSSDPKLAKVQILWKTYMCTS
ncbi:hypothetical protein BpHYR1_015750 [Brachionus plicatilis]|uniref:Uncharacterized protein n=1 Tax=Brachionus plicatilis TaxID=10195 RepID=A0A3M7PCU2_BRAPC|nr:hypothetical protein BpHYR1_015750 [Brachionus plicatilis]